MLDTVVVNTTVDESPAVLELLRVWSLGEYAPLAADDERPFRLVLLLNQEPGAAIREAVEAAACSGPLAPAIGSLDFEVLALPVEYDRYERHGRGEPGDYGFKSGPNVQFFRGLERLQTPEGGFALVVETDTRPIRAGWVTAARQEAARHPDAWVIGSTYRGPERTLAPSIRHHLNGNAIYSLSAEFGTFRRTCWEPALKDIVRSGTPSVAYDYALELVLTTDAAPARVADVRAVRDRLVPTDFVQNLVVWSRYDPHAVDWPAVVSTLRRDHPDTYVVHGVRGERRPPWD